MGVNWGWQGPMLAPWTLLSGQSSDSQKAAYISPSRVSYGMWLVDSPHKGPLMWSVFTYDDLLMDGHISVIPRMIGSMRPIIWPVRLMYIFLACQEAFTSSDGTSQTAAVCTPQEGITLIQFIHIRNFMEINVYFIMKSWSSCGK